MRTLKLKQLQRQLVEEFGKDAVSRDMDTIIVESTDRGTVLYWVEDQEVHQTWSW